MGECPCTMTAAPLCFRAAGGLPKAGDGDVEDVADDDDEVEDLDVDVIAAVALRDKISSADGDKKQSLDTKKQKLSKKAAKRAAVRVAREIEEGYAGDGVWEKDGYDVAVAGENSDGRRLGTASAMAFLAKGFGRNKRSGAMLLDPKMGKPLRVGGVAKLGVGKKRK